MLVARLSQLGKCPKKLVCLVAPCQQVYSHYELKAEKRNHLWEFPRCQQRT